MLPKLSIVRQIVQKVAQMATDWQIYLLSSFLGSDVTGSEQGFRLTDLTSLGFDYRVENEPEIFELGRVEVDHNFFGHLWRVFGAIGFVAQNKKRSFVPETTSSDHQCETKFNQGLVLKSLVSITEFFFFFFFKGNGIRWLLFLLFTATIYSP